MSNLLRLNQEEVEGINRQIISNKLIIFKIPKTKVWEHMADLNSTKHLHKS